MPVRQPSFRLVLALVLLALSLLASLAPPAGAHTNELRRLQQTKGRIAEVRRQMERVATQRQAGAAQLAEAEARVTAILDAVEAAELAVQRQQQAVDAAQEELERLRDQEARTRAQLRDRALRLFKQGTGVPFGAILAAATPGDAVARSSYVDIVNRADRRRFESVSIAQVAVDAQRERLEAEEQGLAAMLGEQRELLAEVEAIRDSRAAALAGVAQKLRGLQAQERHLESQSRQIAALARRSSARTSRSGSSDVPGLSRGGWTWPTRGPVTSEYGRRWGRMHEGIDIGAGTGSPIFAARDGVVSYVGRMSGYGNLTLVDHGGGFVTAYAHQSRVGVSAGERVTVGEVIGAVGCSGSCTGPHLHFEIRVNGSPRNPRNYLP